MGDISYRPLIDDMTFSYSRIKSYEACPYGWKLNYIDEEPKSSQFYASYGSLFHDVIAEYYRGNLTKPELPVEFLTRFSTDVKGVRPSAKVIDKYVRAGVDYLETFEPFDLNILEVEKKVSFEISGTKMVGFIDVIGEKNGDIVIVDHKSHELKPRSGRKKPTVKDLELDEYLRQLYLYSIPIKEIYGKYPTEMWFNCYRNGCLIKEQFYEQKLEENVLWAANLIEKIKEDTDFEANYSYFYCHWICDQNRNCEVFEEEVFG